MNRHRYGDRGITVLETMVFLVMLCVLCLGLANILFVAEGQSSSLLSARDAALVAAENPGCKRPELQSFQVPETVALLGRLPMVQLRLEGRGLKVHAAAPRDGSPP